MTEQEMLMVEAARRGLLPPPQPAQLSFFQGLERAVTGGNVPVGPADVSSYQRGVLRGVRDPIDAGAQLVTRGLEAVTPGNMMTGERQRVEQINREGEKAYQAERTGTGFDLGRTIGNVAGTLPVAAAAPATIAGGAMAGAASNVLQPVDTGEDAGDYWLAKLKQAGIGGALGGIGSALTGAASRIISPKTRPEVKALMDAGGRPTPGQMLGGAAQRMEEKATSVPFLGDAISKAQTRSLESFNRAALNKALAPIGQKLDPKTMVGREAVEEAGRKITDAYDSLLPNVTFRADTQFVQDVASLRQLAQNLSKEGAEQFDRILKNEVLSKLNRNTGLMSGETFKEAHSEIGRLAAEYRGSSVAGERRLGDALKQLHATLRDSLRRVNPDQAAQLGKVDQAYAMLLRMENAAARTGSKEGVFSTAALRGATRQMDSSLRKRAFARGDALLQDFAEGAEKVIGPRVPDSGTTGRALVATLPAIAATYANPWLGAGVGAAMLPYTPMGQKLTTHLLASRPPLAQPLSQAVRNAGPYVGSGLPLLAPGLLGALGAEQRF